MKKYFNRLDTFILVRKHIYSTVIKYRKYDYNDKDIIIIIMIKVKLIVVIILIMEKIK